jgi:trigger factor
MRATVTPTDNDQVQLLIEVDEPELADAIERTVQQLSRELNIKGFRKGKAPRQVIEARIGGSAAMRAEAIRSSTPEFYARAVSEALIDPIDQPSVSVVGGEFEGAVTFEAFVSVRPEVPLIGYRDLRVEIPSPVVTDDEVETQITRARETDAELAEVDRPIVTGDVILADIVGVDTFGEHEGVGLEDYSYTVGSGTIAEGLDESLVGHRVGDTVEAAGRKGKGEFLKYEITVKKVSEKILPDLTDEWVSENSEYATVAALREGIFEQLRRMKLVQAQLARRDAMLQALGDLVEPELAPETLVGDEIQHRLSDLSQRLDQRGLNFDYFLQITNQTPEQLMASLREDAERAVRVDLALRALVRLEALEPTDEEIAEELVLTAASLEVSPGELRETLYLNGRLPAFYAEVAKVKASRWMMEHITYVDDAGAEIDRELLETDHSDDQDAYGESDE